MLGMCADGRLRSDLAVERFDVIDDLHGLVIFIHPLIKFFFGKFFSSGKSGQERLLLGGIIFYKRDGMRHSL